MPLKKVRISKKIMRDYVRRVKDPDTPFLKIINRDVEVWLPMMLTRARKPVVPPAK